MSRPVSKPSEELFEGFLTLLLIGKGTFGQVYKVRKSGTQMLFAIKAIDISDLNAKDVEHAETEVRNLKTLSHENLVRYKGDFRKNDGKTICIVMELCDCTLRTYLKEKRCAPGEPELIDLLQQICRGLKYMHDKDVLHRDIKPTNILVSRSKEPHPLFKLADFGLARDINVSVDGITKYVGTLTFMSPEMIRGRLYKKPTDIWSLACCVYEMTAGVRGVDEKGNIQHERSWDNWTHSEWLKSLLQSMFQHAPEDRPTVDGILATIETKSKPQSAAKSKIPNGKKSAGNNLSKTCPAGFLPTGAYCGIPDENEPEDTPRENYVTVEVQVKMSRRNADYLKQAEHCYLNLVKVLDSDARIDKIEAAIEQTKHMSSEKIFLERMKMLLPKQYSKCEVDLKNYRNCLSALYKTPLMPSFRGMYLKKR